MLTDGGANPPPRLPKICHTYSTMMKLGTVLPYLKKIQKIYKSYGTPHEFCWYVRKSPEISNFSCIKKYRYRLYFNAYVLFLLTFLSLVLIQIVAILMMSAILATLEFLKIKVFWNKGYEVNNFCPWRYQQNFITWFKLSCRRGHVTKVW